MADDSDPEGRPTEDVPERAPTDEDCMARRTKKAPDGTSIFKGYCRNTPGKGTDHVGAGRCSFHGGATPSGPDHGAWEHGIYSQVVRDEDRPVLEALADLSTASKLEDTLNLQFMKIHRAVEAQSDADTDTFWTAFAELVDKTEEPSTTDLQALARMAGTNERALRDLMCLARKTAKTLHDITEGETVHHEHGVNDDEFHELQALIKEAY